MAYIQNTERDQQAMLEAIGAPSLDALFSLVPADFQLGRQLDLPPAMGELELAQHMERLASLNASTADSVCFLGGGSYDHFIPSVVDYVASRGEFYTSYTPYQPEASQGNLQAFFEYQTLVTELFGMDVSNASLYDGGSAAVEAVLMSINATGRSGRVVTASCVNPEYRQILETYLANLDVELVTLDEPLGVIDPEKLAGVVNSETACVLIQQPNFFGCLEDAEALAEVTHNAGAAFVASVDPLSMGLLKRPGDYGADIVVAEGQGLGTPMQFGGPYLGIMACREAFVRKMPGRITGETVDNHGKRCWVLTLQTREQHIRRAKATSNICTNQGLLALRATVYLASLGPQGLREAAELCLQKAHYAADRLSDDERFELEFPEAPFFKEFVVRDRTGQVADALVQARRQGILAGIPLGRWYDEMQDCFLVAVTEKRTRQQIDQLAASLVDAKQTVPG